MKVRCGIDPCVTVSEMVCVLYLNNKFPNKIFHLSGDETYLMDSVREKVNIGKKIFTP